MAVENDWDLKVILRFEISITGDIGNDNVAAEPTCSTLQPRQGFCAEATTGSGQENELASAHYGDPTMRPATAAVIIGLLVLILASSLIWLQRSF